MHEWSGQSHEHYIFDDDDTLDNLHMLLNVYNWKGFQILALADK